MDQSARPNSIDAREDIVLRLLRVAAFAKSLKWVLDSPNTPTADILERVFSASEIGAQIAETVGDIIDDLDWPNFARCAPTANGSDSEMMR